MTVENILISLVRSEICGTPPVAELTPEAMQQLYTLSVRHDLSHLAASALLKAGLLREDKVSCLFHEQMMLAVYLDGQKEGTLAQLGSLLSKAKIPHILLKGAVLRSLYPDTWMRTSCDIDVLIKKEDTEAALRALSEAGYRRENDRSTHDYNLTSPNQVHIELHYTLTQGEKTSAAGRLLESVWESFAEPESPGAYGYRMTPEFFMLYHLAHMSRHLLHGGCGIRPFIDLWLLEKHMPMNHEKLENLLKETQLDIFYKAALSLSCVWLEGRCHDAVTEQLEAYILHGGIYGSSANAAKMKAARGVGKLRSFLGIMFLPKENLQLLYPALSEFPFLFPFYQVKRWFRIFNTKKRQKVKHLVESRNAVSADEERSAGELLESLGLK